MSPQTKEEIKEYHRAYRNRPEVKEYRQDYNHSEKGRESRQKYYYSAKGKAVRDEYYQKPEVKERKRLQSKKERSTHPQQCDCPPCVRKREHNREHMNNYYKEHPIKTCTCSSCEKRREAIERNYPKKKVNANDRKRRFKEAIVNLLGGECAYCGYIPKHVCQIDLHERNGNLSQAAGKEMYRRSYNPSILSGTKKGRNLIIANIDHIVPLCRNCHIRLTCKLCSDELEDKVKNWRRPNVKVEK